jgi:hypothetical protein
LHFPLDLACAFFRFVNPAWCNPPSYSWKGVNCPRHASWAIGFGLQQTKAPGWPDPKAECQSTEIDINRRHSLAVNGRLKIAFL